MWKSRDQPGGFWVSPIQQNKWQNNRCPQMYQPMRHSYPKLTSELNSLMKSALLFVLSLSPNLCRAWKIMHSSGLGTRRLCVTHKGLAGFSIQSSDILRLFNSHRTLWPTYWCCIIIKNYGWSKCSGVIATDRTETCWIGNAVWGPQSCFLSEIRRYFQAGKEEYYGEKNLYDFL